MQDDLRPQKAVPGTHEADEAERSDHRAGNWHYDAPVDPKFRASIDTRRLKQLIGHLHDRLPKQKDTEHAHGTGDYQPKIGIYEPEAMQQLK